MLRPPNVVRCIFIAIVTLLAAADLSLFAKDPPGSGAPKPGEPTDPKARKTFAGAGDWEKNRNYASAVEDFLKANKQDGGHCAECLKRAYKLALQINGFKEAEEAAREWLAISETDTDKASNHFRLAMALQREGAADKKDKCFSESCDEFKAAANLAPQLASTHYMLGVSLAHLRQDDAARAEFGAFLKQDKQNPDMRERAERYLDRIELARATMAPPFSLTTLDGKQISMDGLAGKVVLIDFWATWCGPCREALPHVRRIAQKFAGQPFVVLSISLDSDDAKWKDFVQKNEMTWLQYRNGSTGENIARQFNVTKIPATFTIDADGVLEDQHVGDADIEGKLKKLIALAVQAASRKPVPLVAEKSPDLVN
jgi:thiol-disulfide isomerase/thioredoxin